MNTQTQQALETLEQYKKNWGWYLFLGLLLMVLGVVGAIYAWSITAFAMLWIGILLIVAAVFQFIYGVTVHGWQSKVIHILLSLLALAVGIFLIAYPLQASVIVTLFIGWALVIFGILRIIAALQIRENSIWWLVGLAGLISVILGVLILAHWPVSGLWIIGFFISIEVFLTGWSMLIMSIAAKFSRLE